VHRASTADTLAIEFKWMGIYNFDRNAFITTTHYDFLVKNLGIQLQLQLHIKVCKSKKKKKSLIWWESKLNSQICRKISLSKLLTLKSWSVYFKSLTRINCSERANALELLGHNIH
jgi:hypothetical protein